MNNNNSTDTVTAKLAVFKYISLMSAIGAISTSLVFVVILFMPNSGTAPDSVIFMSYLALIAMPVGFYFLYKWSRRKEQAIAEAALASDIGEELKAKLLNSARERSENKVVAITLIVVLVLVALIMFGLKSCISDDASTGTSVRYVDCSKCGTSYRQTSANGNYIASHGVCPTCARNR